MNKNNPFRKESFSEKSKKESEWGKVKFNPVSRTAFTEPATPWSHFKNDIIKKQQEENNETLLNTNNAKEILKKREETYRRNLIKAKINEPTKWEDFSDEKPSKPLENCSVKTFSKLKSNIKNIETIRKKDFDSKLLTPQQNMYLKKMITKNAKMIRGVSLKQAVKDMKLKKGISKDKFK